MTNVEWPEWLSVGKPVEIERRLGRSVAWRSEGVVVRHTRTQVVVQSNQAMWNFRPKYGAFHLIPKYLDYTTVLNPRRQEKK